MTNFIAKPVDPLPTSLSGYLIVSLPGMATGIGVNAHTIVYSTQIQSKEMLSNAEQRTCLPAGRQNP